LFLHFRRPRRRTRLYLTNRALERFSIATFRGNATQFDDGGDVVWLRSENLL